MLFLADKPCRKRTTFFPFRFCLPDFSGRRIEAEAIAAWRSALHCADDS
jgi:hypothetical protein